jgi:hypothetical protein
LTFRKSILIPFISDPDIGILLRGRYTRACSRSIRLRLRPSMAVGRSSIKWQR